MEYLGQDPGVLGDVYGTLHWGPGCGKDVHDGGKYGAREKIDFTTGFHEFSVVWSELNVTFFVDDFEYWMVDKKKFSPSEPFYLILNTAVGGFWPGPPDNQTVFPQYHFIDWVRVWK